MVETEAPEITEMKYYWGLVRDCVAGERVIKSRGELYLPRKGGQDQHDYEAYKARAKWGDYTEETLRSMHGMILRRAPIIDVPESEELKKCLEDFDKEGHSLYQHASTTIYDNLQTTFGGMLVDMPDASGITNEYEAIENNIRPYARYYPAESIVNYKYTTNNSARELSLVVLREFIDDYTANEFSHEKLTQYRVLDLDGNGFYRVRIFRQVSTSDDKKKENDPYEEFTNIPVEINGQRLSYIPFYFMPDIRPSKPEKPILNAVAELNKHYYMQSADYENGVHFTTIPTLWITGHDMDAERKREGEPLLKLGGDSAITLQESDAKVGTVQFAGDGLTHSANAKAETLEQIGIIATRALSPDKSMGETSDAARIHRAGENARLSTYVRNVSECYTKVVQVMADWIGVQGKVNIQFNVDFDTIAFDPNALNSIANLAREGKYPLPLVFEALKKGEYMPNDITLDQYMLLIALERGGIAPKKELELWRKIRNGEEIDIDLEVPTAQVMEETADNNKNPEDTKIVSMENGK